MGTVTIAGTSYTIYGTKTGAGSCAEYAAGSLVFAATWSAATADNQSRALVEASRLLDRQRWQGDKADAGQALAWPRTGVTVDGAEVGSASIPADLVTAAYELALAALADPSVLAETSTGKNVSSVSASGVGVSFFAPTAGSRFPSRVMELLGPYFGGATDDTGVGGFGLAGSYASGVTYDSAFDDCDTFTMAQPE